MKTKLLSAAAMFFLFFGMAQAVEYQMDTSSVLKIIAMPAPQIASGGETVCAGELFTYQSNADASVTYKWEVTGGTISGASDEQNVSIIWGTGASGSLKLVHLKSPSGCDDSTSLNVTINPLPTPAITTAPNPVCANNAYTYTGNTGTGVDYKWEVTEGSINGADDGTSIDVTWGTEATGSIRYIQTNSTTGCVDTAEQNITINPLPTPSIITADAAVCADNLYSYTGNTPSGVSFKWVVSGGTISGADNSSDVEVEWGATGVGFLKYILTDNSTGCKDSIERVITINPLPVPQITSAPDPVCTDNSYTYTGNSGPDLTYKWRAAGGTISGADNGNSAEVIWGAGASGQVTYIQTNNVTGCVDSAVQTITINPLPASDISGNDIVCASKSENYSGPSGANMTYSWSAVGGTVSGSSVKDAAVTWGAAGNGTVKLIVTNSLSGCKDSTEMSVTINAAPSPTISGSGDVCPDEETQYSTPVQSGHTYLWRVAGGNINGDSTRNNVDIIWGGAGGGLVTLIMTNSNGCDASVTKNITVNPQPNPLISGPASVPRNSTKNYSVSSNAGYSQVWEAINGTISGDNTKENVSVVWGDPGVGTVRVMQTSNKGCLDTTVYQVTITSTDISLDGDVSVCENSAENYTTESITGKEYLWSVKGGTLQGSATAINITVDWAAAGTGEIKLIQTTTASGYKDSVVQAIAINPMPIPAISGSASVLKGSRQSYSVNTPSGSTNEWEVTGGSFVAGNTGSNVEIDWGAAGAGKLKVTQTSEHGCTASDELDVAINESIIEINSEDPNATTNVCENSSENYSTPADAAKTNQWYAAGGAINGASNSDHVTVDWGDTGSGTLKLIQTTTSTQFRDSVELNITINAAPKPTITGPGVVKVGSTQNYSTNTNTGTTYKWTATGGTISGADDQANVTVDWGTEGSGKLTIEQTNQAGCTATAEKNITISNSNVVISGNDQTCEGTTEEYTADEDTDFSYKWTATGGQIQGADNTHLAKVLWNTTGSIKLVQTVISTGLKDSMTLAVTVNPMPTVSLDKLFDICINDAPKDLAGGNPTGGIYSGDGVSGGKFDPQQAGLGTHEITYTYTNASGCSDSATGQITVEDAPAKPEILTNGKLLTLITTQNDIKWYKDDQIIPGENSKQYTVTESGSYSAEVTASNGCSIKSDVYFIDLGQASALIRGTIASAKPNEIIEIPIILQDTLGFVENNITGIKGSIKFNSTLLYPIGDKGFIDGDYRIIPFNFLNTDIISNTAQKQLQFETFLGNDTATAIEFFDLEGVGGDVAFTVEPGSFTLSGVCMEGGYPRLINTDGVAGLYLVSPNPNEGEFEVEFELIEKGQTQIYIADEAGNIVKSLYNQPGTKGKHNLPVTTEDMPSGMYFIIMQTPTGKYSAPLNIVK